MSSIAVIIHNCGSPISMDAPRPILRWGNIQNVWVFLGLRARHIAIYNFGRCLRRWPEIEPKLSREVPL